ncbi:MAG: DNA mismatch repair endonuclease MutL, partial [Lachnospiraceae bacterium]|nr:DNA mismatch repair endonuclease MutL [Lachnospiraceae bacterium]
MGKIHVLDKFTIDKIAAGEVVERPLSVVKELMENSVDAGADSITVEIKDGGISYIRITDNGNGIATDDLEKAFLRHSTSKIEKASDLETIHSLGFRGEALSSICAVSQMEVITKTEDEMMGNRVIVEGSEILKIEQTGAPDGTTMIVKNLFFNTPARRKFLKTAQTEGAYIASLIERMSLSHPEIAMRFIANGQTRLQTAGNGNLEDTLYRVFGRDVLADCMPFSASKEEIAITGYIAKPALSRGNRNYEHFYVNGRYIKSNLLSKAVEEAYKTFVMQHKFPFVVLKLEVPPELVDVNVHPTKMEVRFANEAAIYELLVNAIRTQLANRDLIARSPMVDVKEEKKAIQEETKRTVKPEPFEHKKLDMLKKFVRETSPYEPKFNRPVQPVYTPKPTEEKREEKVEEKPVQQTLFSEEYHFLKQESVKEHRIIGQVFETYWLVEFRESLYIIDQHAAHERVLFERTMKQLESKEMMSQTVAPPLMLTLNEHEQLLLSTYKEQFSTLGYVFETFG